MNRTFVAVAALSLLPLLGARSSSAQVQPLRLRFSPPQFSLRLQPLQVDSGRPRMLRLAPSAAPIQCPMPVSVPDTSSLERMPVARANTSGMAMRIVPPGCVNPLGPSVRRTAPPGRPQHP
jgi:hypothetical protein